MLFNGDTVKVTKGVCNIVISVENDAWECAVNIMICPEYDIEANVVSIMRAS